MAKGRPQWVEAVPRSDRLEPPEGEPTGRGEALALALAEGAQAKAAAATAAAIVKEQWHPTSPAQARLPSFSCTCWISRRSSGPLELS